MSLGDLTPAEFKAQVGTTYGLVKPDWKTHCHILPHAGDGMMTVLRVED